ncbi:hypothetical protein M9H77_23365 [Catharanthus roseus]|uniref:Uncharacterized protein n=1 Tax=Catharanthus roseus TaxID=4058 RepID=A0ACC0AUC2_CATRO|nr:hypothetical protein M9H77_23365 [Catharanthus roseus]
MKYPLEVETMKRKRKWSENDKNESRWQKDRANHEWWGIQPSIVGAKDNFKFCARFTFLDSRIEDFDSRFRSSTFCLPIAFLVNLSVARLDYLQSCLELKRDEQSWATDWGLIGTIY